MATVTFTIDMPSGVEWDKLFSQSVDPITDGNFGSNSDGDTAEFQIYHPDGDPNHKVDVFYGGPALSASRGDVSYLRFSFNGATWLTIGRSDGPAIFSYENVESFHRNGLVTVLAVLAEADHFIGSSKSDFMKSYAGDDTLDGGQGADLLYGGRGNDLYIVDNSDDRVLEAVGEGYDTVATSVSFGLAEGSEIEVLRASVSAFNLALYGNQFANWIEGTWGSDTIGGGGGADTLIGGAGDDEYHVDSASDVVLEYAGGGYDTVLASASYALGANIEVLKAVAGAGPVSLIGNALANDIFGNADSNAIYGLDGNDRLFGDGGNDAIYGGSGSDTLYGGLGDNALYGEDGNDVLYGGDERDTLYGGGGDDQLFGGLGTNKLYGENGNDVLFGGSHVDTLVGGAGNDKLFGDRGNDYLDGGPGRDTLSGGPGKDSFVFRDRLNAKTNVDTVTDFQINADKVRLENAIFKKLGKAGKLNPDFFTIGTGARDANDHLVFNKKAGFLYYDADGSGPGRAIVFAKFKPGIGLDAGDFLVI